jgi:hypothetical protein
VSALYLAAILLELQHIAYVFFIIEVPVPFNLFSDVNVSQKG